MFLNALKQKKVKRFLTKHAKRPLLPKIDHVQKIERVACIVNLDEFMDLELLQSLADAFQIPPQQFHLMGYRTKSKKLQQTPCALFSLESIAPNIRITEKNARLFLREKYDILINYFSRKPPPLLYLSTLTDAAIRVGFSDIDARYNDLIFKIDIKDFSLFKSELLNYLKILKKL